MNSSTRVYYKITPQIDEKRVRRHPGAAQSTNEATDGRFCRSFCEKLPDRDYDFDPILAQKMMKNAIEKMVKKRLPPKTTFFGIFLIFRASRARF